MKQITGHLLDQLSVQAAQNPRLRANHNLHPTHSDVVQRLAIAMEPRTYIRPHRHPHTWELLMPLRGRFVVLQFNPQGEVIQRTLLSDEAQVLEMPAGTWHAVLSLDQGGIIFEIKQGAYQPVAEKDTQPWAPAEGQPGIEAIIDWYAKAQVGERYRIT